MAFDNTDFFYMLATGNPVAIIALVAIISSVGLGIVLLILWLKLPSVAKIMFRNNFGLPMPIFIECFVNNSLKFIYPRLFRNTLAKAKDAWFVPPTLWATAHEDMKKADLDLVTTTYHMEGAPGQVYLNYSVQSQVVSPKLAAFLQHADLFAKIKTGKVKPKVKIDAFLAALQELKDSGEEFIEVVPVNLDFPIDIKALKTTLGQKSFAKSSLAELERQVRNERQCNQNELGKVTIAIILILVGLVIGAVTLLKVMGLF